jgi:hypothetical protein
MPGDPDYLAGDPHWLQVRFVFENRGSRALKITDVREKLADNTVIASASQGSQLMKPPPSMVKTVASGVGIGLAGAAIGMVFPPAMLLGDAAMVFGPMARGDREVKRAAQINEVSLRPNEPVAPGTSIRGDAWLPAVTGQTGLIVFYEAGGASQSLSVPRDPS